jgi:uncharacterized protein (TIGR03084 family)
MDPVRIAIDRGIMTATLVDLETRNALGGALIRGLLDAIAAVNADPELRALVITNEGPSFCAGANLKERAGAGGASASGGGFDDLLAAIQTSPRPIVGRIAGHVMGGGNGLAAALDISIAADDVQFGFTEVRLGVAPAIISVVCLPKMRRGDALEAFLRGNRVPAARAAELGLINRAVPRDALDAAVGEVLDDLRLGGPTALGVAKSLVYQVPELDPAEAMRWATKLSAQLFAGPEAAEGVKAFREKRAPSWAAKPKGAAMLQESLDLIAEADELHAFLRTLRAEDWSRPTPFLGWTPWDVVAHLHFFDKISLLALTHPEAFAAERKVLIDAMKAGATGAEHTRSSLGDLSPQELLMRWHQTCHAMARELGASDPKRRLPWFGPDMGVRMFTTARFMETWAHGQDVYDLLRVQRSYNDRIKHIAEIGVKTFGWTFANRGLPVPGGPPRVRLVAPSGAIWEWNAESTSGSVAGTAVDFCHVVTQGRNVADSALEVVGDVATRWMAIAQCFAGGPADPPKPGARAWR